MKTTKLIRLLASAGCSTLMAAPCLQAANYPNEILNDGPLAYYRLNENVAVPPHDYCTNSGSLGFAGYGQYTSGALHPVAGAIVSQPGDTAASFPNQAVNRMRVPFNAALNVAGPFTFEFWAKPAALSSADSATMCPASFTQFGTPPGGGDGSRFGWLFYQNGANNWTFRSYGVGNVAYAATGGSAPVVGTWYHIAGVWDGSTTRLYVNGQQVAATAAATFAPVPDTTIPLTLGARADGQLGGFRYNGDIDEAAYYATALSATRILAHYEAGTSASPALPYQQVVAADAPVGYWRMNEPAYNSANNPTAVNAGSLSTTADAKYYGGVVNSAGPRAPTFPGFEADNRCGNFDGGSGYVGSPLSLLNNRAKYTVLGWLRRGTVHTARGGYFGQNDLLEFGDADNGVNVEAWVDAISTNLKQAWPWADDQWGFICLTGDGQVNTLYMDGVAVQTKPSNVLSYGANTWKFNIGGGGIFNTGGDFFRGDVDEVAMFDKALTPGRIMNLYCIASGAAKAPTIFTDPVVANPTNTVFATTTFTLSVDVGGSQPITYQWYKGGSPIAGATLATYTKENCAVADSGDYTVAVTNAFGGTTSLTPLTMTVNPVSAVAITEQPISRTIYAGGNFTFRVTATGTSPRYQWKRNGGNLAGETNATISVVASAGTAGTYTCGVSNLLGGVLSDAATATLGAPAANSYEAAVVADAPHAYWRMDETGGTLIMDSYGRHDGTASGFLFYSQSGALVGNSDPSIQFDGVSGKVDVPYSAALNGSTFTIECWANPTYSWLTSHASPVTSRDSSANIQNGYMFYATPNGATWDGWLGRAGYAGGWSALTGPAVVGLAWTHLVMTYDAATSNQQFYVNGVLVNSATTSFGPNLTRPFRMGAGSSEGSGDYWFPGNVDEVAYYPTVLSADRISLHYGLGAFGAGVPATVLTDPQPTTVYAGYTAYFSATYGGTPPYSYQWLSNGVAMAGKTSSTLVLSNVSAASSANYSVRVSNNYGNDTSAAATLTVRTPTPGTFEALVVSSGPLAYWRLGESSGLVAYDYAGGNHAAYNNVTLGATGALVGDTDKAGTFNGTDSYVGIGNPASLNFAGNITMSAWIKPTATDGLRNILVHGYQTSPVNSETGIRINGGRYTAWSWDGSVEANYTMPAEDVGNWVHIVGTYDGTAWRLYRNGIEVAATAGTVGAKVAGAVGWAIGARGTGTERFFGGDIDEVAIWNRALSAPEVCAMYQKGAGYFGSLDPKIALISGSGPTVLTNVNFAASDAGYTVSTSVSAETDWQYLFGQAWWSPGQGNAFGANNISYLQSPAYTVTQSGAVVLSFTHRYSFEADWDGGVVEASVNGGPWQRVIPLAFTQNGYNGVVRTDTGTSLAGARAFYGNSAGQPASLTSSCLIAGVQPGNTVSVRFMANYDNNTTGNLTPSGWEISSVQIIQGTSGAALVTCPCGLQGKAGSINGPWTDLGTGSAVISTTTTNQQYFRMKQ